VTTSPATTARPASAITVTRSSSPTLIGQLALQSAPDTILTRLAGPPSWLFPGNDPTRPASHAYLLTGLRRHGITTHAARNTAVGTLAAELPAPVLADITGLHITTATRWTRSTRSDWTQNLAAREQQPGNAT